MGERFQWVILNKTPCCWYTELAHPIDKQRFLKKGKSNMADCELLPQCVFFNDKMANMPITAKMAKDQYCRGDNSLCARYMVFKALGRSNVPPDLFPNETLLAKKIIAEKGKAGA